MIKGVKSVRRQHGRQGKPNTSSIGMGPGTASTTVRALVSMSLAAALAATCGELHAQAVAPTQVKVQLPPASLDQTLNRFAALAGVELAVDGALTEGRRSPGLQGSYSIEQGFAEILKGQGLVAVRGTEGGYALRKAASVAPESGQALPAVTISAESQRSAITDQSGSYTTRALSMGKLEQSLRETPQSVSVVTRQQMDDQNLVQLDQVLAQATGFTRTQRNFGSHTFVIRGFAINNSNYLQDGVPGTVYDPTGWLPIDTAIYDRVEILRGASGLVVSAADPSGAVNLVRKRPRAEPHFDVNASAGSWGNYRTEVDAGGPINAEGTLRGRVVAAYQDRNYFYDVTHSSEPLLYGMLEADLSRDTRLGVGLRHQENRIDGYWLFGLPRYADGSALNVSRSTSLVQRWNRNIANVTELFADLEHRFDADWKTRLTFSHAESSLDQRAALPRGTVDPVTQSGSRFYSLYYKQMGIVSDGVDANLTGQFRLLGGAHQLMVGASAVRMRYRNSTASISANSRIDINHPNPDAIAEPAATPAWSSDSDVRDERYGVYGSTRLQLVEPFHLLLGGRFSWLKYQEKSRLTGLNTSDYKQVGQFTPYAGVVYDLNRQWSVYASYTDTFQPQSAYQTASGTTLKPAIGSNTELGIKGELMDGRLNFSAAVFRIRKNNIAVIDTANLGNCPNSLASTDCYLNASTYRSKGFETEISGELARGWNVAAGYTYLVTRDDEGKSISGESPRHLLRLSTNYRLPGELNAWTIGGAVSAQTGYAFASDEDPSTTTSEGGRAVWDINTSYRIDKHWSAALAVTNLFDKRYYGMVGGLSRGNYYGEPRALTLSLRGSF
ncbi:TonB-dependent siderophore receptor [Herbaspirillum sp. BH-1]|uniref:TonB-dependent siderophore receptor n=1 Tax=Herbaspirillum sp. (strain BH-1) TaxID=2058884 RepID=UPI000CC17064|nr:TonB-dependent receptor [Herbaspirillum sp. BH-1]PLY61086.1 TonB-dependent siderophore receptor [Herbaspirillum sp. BH-1]